MEDRRYIAVKVSCLSGFELYKLLLRLEEGSIRVVDGVYQFECCFFPGIILYFAMDGQGGLLLGYPGSGDEDTVGTMICQIEMLAGYGDEPCISINTTEEGKVTRNRRNVHSGIIHADNQHVG